MADTLPNPIVAVHKAQTGAVPHILIRHNLAAVEDPALARNDIRLEGLAGRMAVPGIPDHMAAEAPVHHIWLERDVAGRNHGG
jgi:hypothetical protein